jgi:hypothetical protein
MDEDTRDRVAGAVAIFAYCFVVSLVTVPVLAMALSMLLPTTGQILHSMLVFPVYLFLGDGLYGGTYPHLRHYNGPGVMLAAAGVWLMTWAGFAWAARNLSGGRQVATAVGLIAVVAVLRDVVLAACGLFVFLEAL